LYILIIMTFTEMKIIVNYLYMCVFIFFYGCKDKNTLVGYATPPKFDHGPHFFDRTGGKNVIKSKNDVNWSFQGITINDIISCGQPTYYVPVSSTSKEVEPKYPVKKYYKSDDRNHSLVGDWFSIEKLDNRHILINMGENKTGEDIHIRVHIFSGNAMENDIEIEQKAE